MEAVGRNKKRGWGIKVLPQAVLGWCTSAITCYRKILSIKKETWTFLVLRKIRQF